MERQYRKHGYSRLIHAETDEERENHKYYARIETGNPNYKWRYFYTKDEYDAYMKKKKNKKSLDDKVELSVEAVASTYKNNPTMKTVTKDGLTTIVEQNIFEKGKTFVDNLLKKPKETLSDVKNLIITGAKELGKRLEVIGDNTLYSIQQMFDPKAPKTSAKELSEKFPELTLKNKETNPGEDQEAINPKYDPLSYDYGFNCTYCTAAYDMRRRGFDVEAAPMDDYLKTPNEYNFDLWYEGEVNMTSLEEMVKNETGKSVSAITIDEVNNAVESSILKNGEGSWGYLNCWWTFGSGHVIAWDVTDGKVTYRDCQSNSEISSSQMNLWMLFTSDMQCIRTDNLEPTRDILEAVRNRG